MELLSIRRNPFALWKYQISTCFGTMRVNEQGVVDWLRAQGHEELAQCYEAIHTMEDATRYGIAGDLYQLEGAQARVIRRLAVILGGIEWHSSN